MNGAYYRLNIRFDLTDKRQREIVERLQALDKKQYGSINKFVVTASEQPPQVQVVAHTLTKEEQARNEQSVLDDLEMFG